jgi:hypothetical protein
VARLVCPYCYEGFAERDIEFRCTGRRSRAGRTCAREIDEVMFRHLGRREALPPVFRADGRRSGAVCPKCLDETTHRVCPVCHSQLPLHFGKVPSRMIALVGARETGKTVFVTVLLHELMHGVGARLNASVVGSDETTKQRFSADYERVLYGERQLLAATRSAGTMLSSLVVPLVFRFNAERPGWLGRPRIARSLLSFFDTAGEDMTSQDSVDLNARYLASADGIILLLDPLQMAGARAVASATTRLPVPAPDAATPFNVLARVTELLEARGGSRASARVRKPLAIAFSKLDTLWHRFPQGSPLRRPPAQEPGFDERDSLDVHEYVRALLDDWGGGQIDQLLQHHYTRYRYFGLSALGESPTADNRVSEQGIHPYRVADPFLWLLGQFGTIPTTRG